MAFVILGGGGGGGREMERGIDPNRRVTKCTVYTLTSAPKSSSIGPPVNLLLKVGNGNCQRQHADSPFAPCSAVAGFCWSPRVPAAGWVKGSGECQQRVSEGVRWWGPVSDSSRVSEGVRWWGPVSASSGWVKGSGGGVRWVTAAGWVKGSGGGVRWVLAAGWVKVVGSGEC